MNVFYSREISGEKVVLDENESGHAARVLRMKQGEKAVILDGIGHHLEAEFVTVHHKKCELKITESLFTERPEVNIHIAIAPTKMNDRMEWFLEKTTEVGINAITPVICAHSERKTINHDRFQKVLIAAMKQSMNMWLPILNPALGFSEFIKNSKPGYIAHCAGSDKTPLSGVASGKEEYTILIGPEGDFSESEISSALSTKWQPVSLGSSRLRTETAGLIACHTIHLINQLK